MHIKKVSKRKSAVNKSSLEKEPSRHKVIGGGRVAQRIYRRTMKLQNMNQNSTTSAPMKLISNTKPSKPHIFPSTLPKQEQDIAPLYHTGNTILFPCEEQVNYVLLAYLGPLQHPSKDHRSCLFPYTPHEVGAGPFIAVHYMWYARWMFLGDEEGLTL